MNYKLSICIPTYNRAPYLKVLLDSILKQIDPNYPVEICISDNASTDNTKSLISSYKKKYGHITYFRSKKNMGFDCNCLKSIAIAHGNYCWLMGDDDKVESKCLNYILKLLEKHKNIAGMSVNVNFYDKKLKTKKHLTRPISFKKNKILTGTEEIFSNLLHHFSFISAQIVNRKLWQKAVKKTDKTFFNAYVHMYVIGSIIQMQPKWLCVSKACVGARMMYHSTDTWYNRLQTAIVAHDEIIKYFFGRGKMYNKLMSSICNKNFKYSARSHEARKEKNFRRKAFPLLINYLWGIPAFWIFVFPWLIIPKSVLLSAHKIKRKLNNE